MKIWGGRLESPQGETRSALGETWGNIFPWVSPKRGTWGNVSPEVSPFRKRGRARGRVPHPRGRVPVEHCYLQQSWNCYEGSHDGYFSIISICKGILWSDWHMILISYKVVASVENWSEHTKANFPCTTVWGWPESVWVWMGWPKYIWGIYVLKSWY